MIRAHRSEGNGNNGQFNFSNHISKLIQLIQKSLTWQTWIIGWWDAAGQEGEETEEVERSRTAQKQEE